MDDIIKVIRPLPRPPDHSLNLDELIRRVGQIPEGDYDTWLIGSWRSTSSPHKYSLLLGSEMPDYGFRAYQTRLYAWRKRP